ncbi:MAG: MurR/RpiR family transcriptional regulator [Bacillota bacterium]
MKNVLVKLREFYPQAQSLEREIVKYVLEQPQKTSEMTVYELAKETYTSPASVIRLCKKLGFTGYKDFSKSLIYELAIRANSRNHQKSEITKSDSVKEIIEKVTYKNIVSLEDTQTLIDADMIEKVVDLMRGANRIALFGLGSSYNVAHDAEQKFMRLNLHMKTSEDWQMQLLTARTMSKGDLGIIISYSGRTDEMIQCARSMKENGVTIVSITKYGLSPIVELSDYNLFVAANESLYRSGAMSSRISQLNIIDILYTGYANMDYETSLKMIEKTHIYKEPNSDESKRHDHRTGKPKK